MKLLIVEDEAKIAGYLRKGLAEEGYVIDVATNGIDGLHMALHESYALIVLDTMLPGIDGFGLLAALRQSKQTPVIMLTARHRIEDRVRGLKAGADDYLVKPFGMMEMISRIKAVLRRTRGKARPSLVTFGDLTLEPQRYSLYHQGERVLLTLKEFDLLSLLMLHPDRVFTRQELLDKVWGTQFFGETRTVDVHIGTLRTKLGACGDYIKTIRGVGYRMEEPHD